MKNVQTHLLNLMDDLVLRAFCAQERVWHAVFIFGLYYMAAHRRNDCRCNRTCICRRYGCRSRTACLRLWGICKITNCTFDSNQRSACRGISCCRRTCWQHRDTEWENFHCSVQHFHVSSTSLSKTEVINTRISVGYFTFKHFRYAGSDICPSLSQNISRPLGYCLHLRRKALSAFFHVPDVIYQQILLHCRMRRYCPKNYPIIWEFFRIDLKVVFYRLFNDWEFMLIVCISSVFRTTSCLKENCVKYLLSTLKYFSALKKRIIVTGC